MSPTAGTLVVSRDPVGAIDRAEVGIDGATLAQAGTVQVVTPPMPLWPAEPVIQPGGLTRFAARIAPREGPHEGPDGHDDARPPLPRERRRGGLPGNVSPSVDAFYPSGKRAGRTTKTLRNWSRYRYLEFTATILKRPPATRPST